MTRFWQARIDDGSAPTCGNVHAPLPNGEFESVSMPPVYSNSQVNHVFPQSRSRYA